ncbi:dephospho-CoA kinase [Gemmiger sp.]
MKVVGITGRSGCGKSSATNFLRERGYPCIDADLVAREVLLPGSPCIAKLQAVFGADIADENGQVRRRLLADRAFATPEGTAALTAITQPEILRRIDAALAEAERGGAKLAFVDGAVIVGTPFEQRCDALILVTAPYDTSVARICARDGIVPEMARRRLDAQTPLETLRAAATAELVNDAAPEVLRQKLQSIVQRLEKEEYA